MNFVFLKNLKEAVTIVIAMFFILTSLFKLFSITQFISDIQNYNILPQSLVIPFSIFTICVELISGFGLFFQQYAKIFSAVLILLLAIFTISISINLLRGNIVDCGCFGDTHSSQISWWSIVRNILFVLTLYRFFLKNKSLGQEREN